MRKGLMGVHNKKLELDHTICEVISLIIFIYITSSLYHFLFICAAPLFCHPLLLLSDYFKLFIFGFNIIVSFNPIKIL